MKETESILGLWSITHSKFYRHIASHKKIPTQSFLVTLANVDYQFLSDHTVIIMSSQSVYVLSLSL